MHACNWRHGHGHGHGWMDGSPSPSPRTMKDSKGCLSIQCSAHLHPAGHLRVVVVLVVGEVLVAELRGPRYGLASGPALVGLHLAQPQARCCPSSPSTGCRQRAPRQPRLQPQLPIVVDSSRRRHGPSQHWEESAGVNKSTRVREDCLVCLLSSRSHICYHYRMMLLRS